QPTQFINPETPGYVGFANLPNQVHRKSVKKGFEFTLMVVGESGLGKSTLINSLFLTDLYPERIIPGAAEKIERTVQIEASTVEIEERGVKLRLTVVDTPGYGDAINCRDCFKTIISYIDEQFERYLHDESGLNRRHIIDNRVHCCFYFISPFGHGLKPLDVAFMKAIHNKVNIVPVIAKADTLTLKERERLKKRILDEIEEHNIKIYHLPDAESDEDEDFKEQTRLLKASIPFSVVGSNQLIEAKGKKVRGRLYPWGVVEVENPEHNDFLKLRTMLIFKTIISYIDEQFERYLHDESGLNRRHIIDNRVHCCFYFISPFGHGLKPLDVAFMKAIHNKVNIVPVIAKADTLTLKERERLKKRLRRMQEMIARMQAQMQMQMQGGDSDSGTLGHHV
ncbi:Septin-2, partial [Microtus ochrogaster]